MENGKRDEEAEYQEFKQVLDRLAKMVKCSTVPRLWATVAINKMWEVIGEV